MTIGESNMQLWARATASEQENERRVVNWLGVIALASLVGVVVLARDSGRTVGIDTAVIVALVGIIAQCASSLGTRRTRMNGTDDGSGGDGNVPPSTVAPAGTPAPIVWPTSISTTSGTASLGGGGAVVISPTPAVDPVDPVETGQRGMGSR